MSPLLSEIGLRLAKAGAAALLGLLLYALLVGPLANPASVELALLSWLAGAAFILLVETSPI
ncbi:MAG: hypothetical protein ACSLFN_03415 [Candidatus Limnocylindrales bacterium]